MNRNSWPPLLRGIGMTIVLLAAVISVMTARRETAQERVTRDAAWAKAEAASADPVTESRNLAELRAEVQELRDEIHEETVAEQVIGDPWFDWLGFLGTAVMASSFYAEWYLRKNEKT